MFKRFTLIAVLGFALSVAFAGTASAEQCSPDGKICLVTDTSQPLVTPTNVQVRVTSEATWVSGTSRLIQEGPDGMNLWETNIDSAESDSVLSLPIVVGGPNLEPTTATFAVSVLAPSVNESVTIRRTKERVTAIYRYEGRTTLKGGLRLTINQFENKDDPIILTYRGKYRVTGPGIQTVKVVIPRKLIKRKCKPYRHCWVYALSRSWAGKFPVDVQTADRKRVQ